MLLVRIVPIKPVVATQSVANDPDDPAIWVHPTHPEQSLILGTNKVSAAEGGSLYVFDLQGHVRQVISDLDRPNNVAIAWGLPGGAIAVVTERLRSQLRLFRISMPTGKLIEIGTLPVFVGESGDFAAPMGIATYRRPRDGAVFLIVGRKSGPPKEYLEQYHLTLTTAGKPQARLVRRFGDYSGKKEIEAIAVDDELGFVYYADEGYGIRQWAADPDSPPHKQPLAVFAQTGWKGDQEGIALSKRHIICTDQIEGGSIYYAFDRKSPRQPILALQGGADATDGIDIVTKPLGKLFPHGLMVVMNNGPKNFLLYDLPKELR